MGSSLAGDAERRCGMKTLGRTIICGLALLSAGSTNLISAQTPKDAAARTAEVVLSDAEKAELKAFSDRANAYIKMEKGLAADRLSPKASVQELEKQRQALRDALQQSRPNAKQGDMFTTPCADVFRKLLRATLTRPGGQKVRTSLNRAEPLGPQNLKVNGVYPNVRGQPLQSVPPTLLMNLPVLPKGLEYRISDHTLALRDADANMVVDYLPDALP